MVPLQDLVEEWLRLDQVIIELSCLCFLLKATTSDLQNSVTRHEIQNLWCAGDTEELEKRMR
jgi:hypothetical protein